MNIHAISSSSKSGISVKLGFEFEAAELYILAFVVKQKILVRNSHYSRVSKQGIPCIKVFFFRGKNEIDYIKEI